MNKRKLQVITVSIVLLGVLVTSPVMAAPSDGFFEDGGDVFDSFGVSRNRSDGEDGFLQITDEGFDPIIARESLGADADLAWDLGMAFAEKYPDIHQRAEQIFYFVRDKVVYTSDIDEFGYDEFAQNADELVRDIVEQGASAGDCEDDAVLLAVLYKAAGYRSAVVLAPGHAAALVHLPQYRKAGIKFTLEGEEGWVWAEATGSTNELGWLAPSLTGEEMFAREVTERPVSARDFTYGITSVGRASSGGGFSLGGISPFFGVVFFMWLLSSLRRPARRRRYRR